VLIVRYFDVSLTNLQQVGNFPVYGETSLMDYDPESAAQIRWFSSDILRSVNLLTYLVSVTVSMCTCLRPRTDGADDPLVSFSVCRTCRLSLWVLRVLAVFGLNATLIFSLTIIIIMSAFFFKTDKSRSIQIDLDLSDEIDPVR